MLRVLTYVGIVSVILVGCDTGANPAADQPIHPCLADPELVLDSPRATDEFLCGQRIDIAWSAVDPCGGFVAKVDAYDNGRHEVIAHGLRNTSSIPWNCPNAVCDELCIRVKVSGQGGSAEREVFTGPVREISDPGPERLPHE